MTDCKGKIADIKQHVKTAQRKLTSQNVNMSLQISELEELRRRLHCLMNENCKKPGQACPSSGCCLFSE